MRAIVRRAARISFGYFIAVACATSLEAQQPAAPRRMRVVAEAQQLGPVGYRDPIGVMSPDGQWLAYSSRNRLQLMRVAGGPIATLGPKANVLDIIWLPDSRQLAVLEREDTTGARWWSFDVSGSARRPLWNRAFPKVVDGKDSVAVDPNRFFEIAWSANGRWLAGVLRNSEGAAAILWVGNADGSSGRLLRSELPLAALGWSPNDVLACLVTANGKQYVRLPCVAGASGVSATEAYGRLAFSPDGAKLYYGAPNARGMLDLWVQPVSGGAATRLTTFERDTYAPSIAKDGRVLFGTQDYRTSVWVMPSSGGTARQLTTFQAETPSWSRDDRFLGVTYGSWRRIVDDLHYPDIAQDLGLVRSDAETPASAPSSIVRASPSEDQGMDWSPNGRWIVLHSHANGLDDVWIQPADGSMPARAITAGGIETGWPRWSPNGKWIAYSSQVREGNRLRGAVFTVGVDSANASVTRDFRRISIDGLRGDVDEVEWSPGSDSLAILVLEGGDEQAIYVVGREGGRARLVHRFKSEQQFAGLGVSPNFRWATFVAPAKDGHFQLFRVPLGGGVPTQLTFDATDKTQPAVSHDGKRIAFTAFLYTMRFWVMEP